MCLEPTEFTVVAEWRPHSLGDCQVLFQRTVGAKVEVVIKQIRLKENLLFFLYTGWHKKTMYFKLLR